MVDRIDIGMDSYADGTETPSFFQSQRTISSTEYGSSFVNFYNTSLGLPTLEEETGIEVETPEVELATPTVRNTTTGGDEFQPNILEQTAFGTGDPVNEVVFGLGTGDFNSYSDYLTSGVDGKFSDRVPLVQNVIQPLAEGRYSDIKFGETASTEVGQKAKSVGTNIQEAPGRLERLATGKLTTKDSNKLVKGALTVMGGLPGAMAGSFIGGRTVKNALGQNSYRPPGALGLVSDVVHSIQYKDVANIRAAEQAAGGFYDTAQGQYITNNALDTGFAMRIGNRAITRSPDSGGYTGNFMGLSREHVKALEAVSKGFDPRGYNMRNPTKSRSRIEEAGGSFISGNPMEGFYRANGTFYSPSANISSAYGTAGNRDALAAKNGITSDQADAALSAARSGETTLKQAIQAIRNVSQPQEPSAESGTYDSQEVQKTQTEQQTAYEKAAGDPYETSADSGTQNNSSGGYEDYSHPDGFKSGGRVGYAPGGAVAQGGSGFVDRPPEQVSEAESVADNQPDAVPEGTFIINSPAVEFAGSDDIRKMLMDAHKEAIRRGITVDNDGKGAKLIDVALSRGEVKVAPHLAIIIGYDRLNKINNRGKPEVEERIKENGQAAPAGTMQAAMGGVFSQGFGQERATLELTSPQEPQGFIAPPTPESHANEKMSSNPQKFVEQPDVGMDVSETPLQAPPAFVAQLEQHYKKPVTRTQNKKLYNNMNEEQLLAHMIMAETNSSVDPEEAMYAVGQTAIHRRNSNEPEFKKQKSLRDVLLKRLPKGAFEYVGMDVKRNKGLKENFTTNRANYEKGLARATVVAQDLLGGGMESDPTVSPDVMWYTRKDAPNQWMRNNLILVKTIGEHEFYKAPD